MAFKFNISGRGLFAVVAVWRDEGGLLPAIARQGCRLPGFAEIDSLYRKWTMEYRTDRYVYSSYMHIAYAASTRTMAELPSNLARHANVAPMMQVVGRSP